MTSDRTLHVLIHGRVQGVGFRAWTHHQAQLHGLKGWVRNRRDGTVEAVFSGPDDMIEIMMKACRQGPGGAVVERIEQLDADRDLIASHEAFEVRETG
jgi:acylphosphatase